MSRRSLPRRSTGRGAPTPRLDVSDCCRTAAAGIAPRHAGAWAGLLLLAGASGIALMVAGFRKGRRRVGKRGDGDAEGHLSAVSFHFLSVGRTCRYEELISRIEVQFMLVEMRALALFRLRTATGHRLYTSRI